MTGEKVKAAAQTARPAKPWFSGQWVWDPILHQYVGDWQLS